MTVEEVPVKLMVEVPVPVTLTGAALPRTNDPVPAAILNVEVLAALALVVVKTPSMSTIPPERRNEELIILVAELPIKLEMVRFPVILKLASVEVKIVVLVAEVVVL